MAAHKAQLCRISTHAPLARCDPFGAVRIFAIPDFNSRTSCEVRHAPGDVGLLAVRISTHAPLARCDTRRYQQLLPFLYFNSRTSCEVRHGKRIANELKAGISTHAPLARCDSSDPMSRAAMQRFQLTHLLRGATRGLQGMPGAGQFQLTHLLRGAT